MAYLKVGSPFIYDLRGKAGDAISRKSLPGAAKTDSLEGNFKTPGRQRRNSGAGKCNCEAFKLADQLYTAMTNEEKDVWRNAVKKNARTGYTVWMSEALHLFQQGKYGPDVPSASGGFSPASAVPGTKYPPPDVCLKTPVNPKWLAGYYAVIWKLPSFIQHEQLGFVISRNTYVPPRGLDSSYWVKLDGGVWAGSGGSYAMQIQICTSGECSEWLSEQSNIWPPSLTQVGQRIRLEDDADSGKMIITTHVYTFGLVEDMAGLQMEVWSVPENGWIGSEGATRAASKTVPTIPMGFEEYIEMEFTMGAIE